VAAVVLIARVAIELRRHHFERQRRRGEQRVTLERAQDCFAELARHGARVRQLRIVFHGGREIAGAAAAVGPVGLLEIGAHACERVALEHVRNLNQHDFCNRARQKRRVDGEHRGQSRARHHMERMELVEVVLVGDIGQVELQRELLRELVLAHRIERPIALHRLDGWDVLGDLIRHVARSRADLENASRSDRSPTT
jgi:hypothetical protein